MFGVYVHVPWCAHRCGYCDFNTYVPGRVRGADPAHFAATAVRELALGAASLADDVRPADTVFLGGGTPTLLGPAALATVLEGVRAAFGIAPGAEVTVEANPESVDAADLAALRAAGFTRLSLGMQSGAAHVLATLDRRHTPGRAAAAAREAREAGFEHVSLDLIYGAPGEEDDDWARTVDAALAAGPDHVAAYALTLEPGTRMRADVRAGRLPALDEDALHRRYAHADAAFTAAGLGWYEVSNWAAGPASRSRHNAGYWTGADWWAAGPGAHGHVAGTRFWTHRHPAEHARAVAAGELPFAGREHLDAEQRRLERIMLETRRIEGLDPAVLDAAGRASAQRMLADGLLQRAGERLVLTDAGRQVPDVVIRALV